MQYCIMSDAQGLKNYKNNLLRHAIEIKNLAGLEAMLKIGADATLGLQHASRNLESLGIIKLLIRYGANINVPYSSGSTLLQRAVEDGNVALVRLLILSGANTTKRFEGRTLIETARVHEKAMVKYRERGGKSARNVVMRYAKIRDLLYKAGPKYNIVPILPRCSGLEFEHRERTPHTVQNHTDFVRQAVQDLKACRFSSSIFTLWKKQKAGHFFFAIDKNKKCVAGAACTIDHVHSYLSVEYLCSSKTCAGAGSFLMKEIIQFATDIGLGHIVLESDYEAANFYPKFNFVRARGVFENENPGNKGFGWNQRIATRQSHKTYYVKTLPQTLFQLNGNTRAAKRQKVR